MTAAGRAANRSRRRRRLSRVGVALAGALLVLLALVAIAPGLFTGRAPNETDLAQTMASPSGAHWFGTDQLGRDVFARVLHGARTSLLVGVGSTAFALLGGTVLGLAAALSGRVGDQVLMRFADVLLSLPSLLLALLAVTVLGTGTVNVMLAVAIAFVPGYARIVRAEALVVRRSGYVEAAVGLGLPRPVLVARHVLPNALGPLLVLGAVGFGTSVIYASGLSFLGLGAGPPSPEWGAMLSEGRSFLATAWWIGVFPGLAITVTVVAVNIVGRFAQRRFAGRTS
ncbi:peptide ABC transporter permease [Protofrankia sp. BMG5.30]|uniref:Peptide ABC transporter permease n=1 Tax=Protofrankia coriariae TaxID=1562887 RepID=A0ABR5F106_9ACTN|nr:peptide ABC transporter permease [Protofrankia coriariae]ONH33572.1 peptide ABC transporter permease [Protofrankia sp. BMG5.30]